MSGKKKHEDLEITEDVEFQRGIWTFQRVAWALMSLLIIATLLGLFGTGLLGQATAGAKTSALWIEYDRFTRSQAETATLRVHFGAGAGADGRVRFWLNREYMENVKVLSISPQPEAVETAADRFTYVFNVPDVGQPATVIFHLEPEKAGRMRVHAGVDERTSVDFNQYIYP